MYAGRWFPFHDYAADPATADITITAPGGLQVVGYSDTPVTSAGGNCGDAGSSTFGRTMRANRR